MDVGKHREMFDVNGTILRELIKEPGICAKAQAKAKEGHVMPVKPGVMLTVWQAGSVMLTTWQYWRDVESGRSVLVAFKGERFGVQFDVPAPGRDVPKMRCSKRVRQFMQRRGLKKAFPSTIALELLRGYVNAQDLVIPSPS